MVLRLQEGGALRPDRPGRRPARGLVGPCRLRRGAQAGPRRRPRGAGAEEREAVVADVHRRTEGRPVLITSDAYPTYAGAILHVYGEAVEETPTGRPVRRMVPERVPPPGLTYATVEKRRRLGRV